ncbi:thioredoxin-disulfide reductase [Nowakowskiella sp. JEL0407]|nr:thioredoxin-disulfide reductase [Nowakowskiella sp. JEL0407]
MLTSAIRNRSTRRLSLLFPTQGTCRISFKAFTPSSPPPFNAYVASGLLAVSAITPVHLYSTSAIESNQKSSLASPNSASNPHKVVIVGSGPAAHTAAIYCARASLNPVLYEGFMAGGVAPGGQLTTTTEVENFPGFPNGVSGHELTELFRAQSLNCGTTIYTETVTGMMVLKSEENGTVFKLHVQDSETGNIKEVYSRSVIIATGATAKRLNLPGEETYWQRGISACAICDGAVPIFRKKPLAVIGGGDSAAEEATFLTKYASVVYLIVRRDKMRASKAMQDRVLQNPKIKVCWNTEPVEAKGDGNLLQELVVRDTKYGQSERSIQVNGLFYAVGHKPNTDWISKDFGLTLDESGYIKVEPGSSATGVEGIFAAGDVQDKKYRQAITAAGSGCMAALDCERWLESNGF